MYVLCIVALTTARVFGKRTQVNRWEVHLPD
jgi:hypothetical protein